ncbi:MAG: hypothetical protein MUF52_05960 [Syntrophobacteraceae bacterium]|nr:hypothetical protein [Syntrophobacteraceae bacterium]
MKCSSQAERGWLHMGLEAMYPPGHRGIPMRWRASVTASAHWAVSGAAVMRALSWSAAMICSLRPELPMWIQTASFIRVRPPASSMTLATTRSWTAVMRRLMS